MIFHFQIGLLLPIFGARRATRTLLSRADKFGENSFVKRSFCQGSSSMWLLLSRISLLKTKVGDSPHIVFTSEIGVKSIVHVFGAHEHV